MKSRKNTTSRKNKQRKTKKIWFMKGCYKKHRLARKCSVCGYKKSRSSKNIQKGGSCGCSSIPTPLQNGGSFYKPAPPTPGPFIGQPWTAKHWPSQGGIGSNNNHYKMNLYHKDPQTMMTVGGKKKYAKSKYSKKRRGGGLIPDSILNLGRSLSYNIGSSYNALAGYPAPVNPLPYKDQLPSAQNVVI